MSHQQDSHPAARSCATPGTIVCILGMHRSGTSCLAGCLEERGLYLGDVVNAAPHNRKGNKENIEFRTINDEVLSLSGGSWDRPPENLRWNDALRARRDAYIASFRSHEKWGFKDPRTVLMLPFWLEALPSMKLIGTFRSPSVVAHSLLSRPGLEPATPPFELWKHYNLRLLDLVAEHNFPLVCFDWPAEIYIDAIEEFSIRLGLKKNSGG